MIRSRISLMFSCLLALVVLASPRSFAESAQPLDCSWLADYNVGVHGDGYITNATNGDANYNNESARKGVKCYFGVNGKDVDLVTYNTGRKLHFVFESGQGIPKSDGTTLDDFFAEVDLVGINYYGPFRTMGLDTTALLQVDLEFHYPDGPNPLTYELEYRALAVKRGNDVATENQWLITYDLDDICSCSGLGFTPSPKANLNVVRRKSVETIREDIEMPIRFRVKYQTSSSFDSLQQVIPAIPLTPAPPHGRGNN